VVDVEVLRDGVHLTASADLPLVRLPFAWDPEMRVAVPPGLAFFKAEKSFSHGGAAVQELIIPHLVSRGQAAARYPGRTGSVLRDDLLDGHVSLVGEKRHPGFLVQVSDDVFQNRDRLHLGWRDQPHQVQLDVREQRRSPVVTVLIEVRNRIGPVSVVDERRRSRLKAGGICALSLGHQSGQFERIDGMKREAAIDVVA